MCSLTEGCPYVLLLVLCSSKTRFRIFSQGFGYKQLYYKHVNSHHAAEASQKWIPCPHCPLHFPTGNLILNHTLRIAIFCLERLPFWGPNWRFYCVKDLWATTTCQQRSLFWVLGVVVEHRFDYILKFR